MYFCISHDEGFGYDIKAYFDAHPQKINLSLHENKGCPWPVQYVHWFVVKALCINYMEYKADKDACDKTFGKLLKNS